MTVPWALGAIVALAFGLRLAHILSLRGDVFFEHPQNDEGLYVALARRLATGGSVGAEPWFQPPGLATVLSFQFRLGLESLLWTRLLHIALGAATCALVFVVARRFASVRVALLAAALTAIHGPSIHATGEILSPIWIAFLDLLALVLITRDDPRWTDALGGGLALGLSALFSPVVVPFLVPAAIWLASTAKDKRWILVTAVVAGTLGPPAAVTYRNLRRSGELVFVAANGGINFYVGNNADYRKTLSTRPGRAWTWLDEEPVRRGIHRLGDRSSYFYGRGFEFVSSKPIDAGALYLRKLFLFFSAHQIPRNSDVQVDRLASPVLGWLIGPRHRPLPDGLLIPLGLVGAAVLLRRRGWVVPLLPATQALVIASFFVTSRYRIPSMPVFCILAAVGATWVADQFRRSRTRGVLSLAGVGALCVASALPLWETQISLASEGQFFRGLAHWRARGSPASAIPFFLRAAAVDPNDARPWFELGNASAALGRMQEAQEAWARAARADPSDPRPRRLLAERRGAAEELDEEGRLCLATLRDAAPNQRVPERICVARAQLRAGDFRDALAMLKQTIVLDPSSVTDARASIMMSLPREAPAAAVDAVEVTLDTARPTPR